MEEVNESDKLAIVVTKRGGHIAFLDGLFNIKGKRYMHRVFNEFFSAIFSCGSELVS